MLGGRYRKCKCKCKWQPRLTDLQRSVFGFWKFSLIQALPALEELLDDGAVRADDLEARDVGPTRKNPVQAHVGKALRAKSNYHGVESTRASCASRLTTAAFSAKRRHLC